MTVKCFQLLAQFSVSGLHLDCQVSVSCICTGSTTQAGVKYSPGSVFQLLHSQSYVSALVQSSHHLVSIQLLKRLRKVIQVENSVVHSPAHPPPPPKYIIA